MSTLTGTGTAILLVYGARLFPARDGKPGMRCTVDSRGAVLVEPVGYPCASTSSAALTVARRTCEDAGLLVVPVAGRRALIVRKP